ncbi:hypothetical protein K7X08_007744 [Anisodus acutangulus]|uniref:DNA replication factor Cdt1 C-terminal domain-containing protein n=1 Tax=Anisodus acutangulus TaxID=402998 RepID=A0A9Q1MSD7_9SOLA|nr:hypothetical protein K7X08_007744 [Anisodus acutangulus]
MIACLHRLFDMIYFLFQSIKRSVMTKEEFMHRVISSHLQITDKSEVEQQLILLQEPASRGTLLLLVYRISNPDAISSRLAEAK